MLSRLKGNYLFLLFFLGLSYSLPGQTALNLQAQDYNFEDQGYFYIGVKDTRDSPYFLGLLYTKFASKRDLVLNRGTEEAFMEHLDRNFNTSSSRVPLSIEINALSFRESMDKDGLIRGSAKMNLSIYALHDGKFTLLCKPYSSSKYERSINNINEASYEGILRQMWISCMQYTDNYIALNRTRLEPFNSGVEIIILPLETRNMRDTVHYLSRKVSWTDFRGEPRYGSKYSAAIFPSIGLGSKLTIRNNKLTAILQPQVYMVQSQSWAKSGSKNNSGLEHEQIHFDITKVVMDRLLGRLKKLNANSMDDLSSMIQYEYLEAYKEMNRIQEAYDSESNHNLNERGQEEWVGKVATWLREP
ncbi:MAG: hypothetical protein ACI8UX_001006 [Psychromonas sp.]|jgi:hypothetical protein